MAQENACQAGPDCFCRTPRHGTTIVQFLEEEEMDRVCPVCKSDSAEWEEIVDGLLEELDEYDEEMDRVNDYAAEQAARTLAAEKRAQTLANQNIELGRTLKFYEKACEREQDRDFDLAEERDEALRLNSIVNEYADEWARKCHAAENERDQWRRTAEARATQITELEVALISAQRQIRALESSPYGPDESI